MSRKSYAESLFQRGIYTIVNSSAVGSHSGVEVRHTACKEEKDTVGIVLFVQKDVIYALQLVRQ